MTRDFHPRAPKRLPGRQPTARPRSQIAGRSLLAEHQTPPDLQRAIGRAQRDAEAKRKHAAMGLL